MSNSIIALNDFLNKLHGVKKAGDGYQAHCPSHDDDRQSLSISQGEGGKILLHCHAGCSVNDVCQALGIEIKDLFPREKFSVYDGGKSQITATYDYQDEAGKLLFQVCRTSRKGFFQRRPDGNGGYINGLGGIKPVLYQLPELLQAVECGDTVFIPEGEKDVDNLIKLGLAATTSAMGAGKWRDYYSKYLKSANVVILPDNDEPGRKHAADIAKSLHGKAASVRVLELPELPEKGDISDWLKNGGTKEDLLQLSEACPEWEPVKKQGRGKKSKEDEKKSRQASFFVDGETLFEQIYVDGKCLFLLYNTLTGETEQAHSLELAEETLEPFNGDDVELGAVKLPSGLAEYGDTLSLLAEIEAHIYKYLDVSPSYVKFAAYYILLSWVYDRFHTLPYLRALGDTGCGKSRFLDVIGGMCYKSISASGCVTPAPIYRMLRKWGGTLVLDEADMKNSDEYSEVVTILNCGFERGRPVLRATKDNPDNIQVLPVYGPKVFATRRRFKDAALEARCLTEIMQETDRDDIPPVLGRKFFAEQQELRNKLLLFRLRNYFTVEPEASANLNLTGIEPRLRQISEAFASLFINEDEVLASYRNFIQEHQRELIEQRASTKVGQVVEAMFVLLEGNKVTMVTSAMGDTTNVTPGQIAEKVNMSPQAVGQVLKSLGLQTKLVKVAGKAQRCVVYNPDKFRKLQKRYILEEKDDEVTSCSESHAIVTNVTNVTENDLTPSQQLFLEEYERGEME